MKATIRARIIAFALAGLSIATTAYGAANCHKVDLLRVMSVRDFRAAGLDKLTDQQIQALNKWLDGYLDRVAPDCRAVAVDSAPKERTHPPLTTPREVTGRISGEVGTLGIGTRFALDNGQTWEQQDDSQPSWGPLRGRSVTIERGSFGAYYLSVDGENESVKVRRVK